MKLQALHFMPGVSLTVGGKYTALSFWDVDRYPELGCERMPNGDAWIFWKHDPSIKRLVRDKAIAWEMHKEEPKPSAGTAGKKP